MPSPKLSPHPATGPGARIPEVGPAWGGGPRETGGQGTGLRHSVDTQESLRLFSRGATARPTAHPTTEETKCPPDVWIGQQGTASSLPSFLPRVDDRKWRAQEKSQRGFALWRLETFLLPGPHFRGDARAAAFLLVLWFSRGQEWAEVGGKAVSAAEDVSGP